MKVANLRSVSSRFLENNKHIEIAHSVFSENNKNFAGFLLACSSSFDSNKAPDAVALKTIRMLTVAFPNNKSFGHSLPRFGEVW